MERSSALGAHASTLATLVATQLDTGLTSNTLINANDFRFHLYTTLSFITPSEWLHNHGRLADVGYRKN